MHKIDTKCLDDELVGMTGVTFQLKGLKDDALVEFI